MKEVKYTCAPLVTGLGDAWRKFPGGSEFLRTLQYGKLLNGKVFRPIQLSKVRGLETKDNYFREAWQREG